MFCDPQFYPLLPAAELLDTETRRTILHARLAQIAPDVALLQEVCRRHIPPFPRACPSQRSANRLICPQPSCFPRPLTRAWFQLLRPMTNSCGL